MFSQIDCSGKDREKNGNGQRFDGLICLGAKKWCTFIKFSCSYTLYIYPHIYV
jgi:hypothetical protein